MQRIKVFCPSGTSLLGHSEMLYSLVNELSGKNIFIDIITAKQDPNLIIRLTKIPNCKLITNKTIKYINKTHKSNFKTLFLSITRLFQTIRMYNFLYKNYFDENVILLENEYISFSLFALLFPQKVKNTIFNTHSVSFNWGKSKSLIENLYKIISKQLIKKIVIKRVSKISVMGFMLKEQLIKELNISKKYEKKIFVLGYGFNLIEAKQDCVVNKKKEYDLLFFGILRKSKGLYDLLNIWKYVPKSYNLLIAGSQGDISYDEINSFIELNKLNNITTQFGFIQESDIESIFNSCEAVMIPHKKDFFSFSGPLALAAQYKIPVICNDVGELAYFVRKTNAGVVINNLEEYEISALKISKILNEIRNCEKSYYSESKYLLDYTWHACALRLIKNFA